LTNTDGDEMRLIKATVRLGNANAGKRLADHPDFDADRHDSTRFTWLGNEVPAARREVMIAELKAQLRAQGESDVDIADEDRTQRWVRGQLELRGAELRVDVNSEERLTRLLEVLDELGLQPEVIDQSRLDPAQDVAWPAGQRPHRGGLAPAAEGWERHWLDERVPALGGRTPRQTRDSGDWPLLEAMLRQFEHDADLLAQHGDRGVDTDWLRRELNLSVAWPGEHYDFA
jgi:hypothetical protein